jgi:RND family efflux transporter MFP subunit
MTACLPRPPRASSLLRRLLPPLVGLLVLPASPALRAAEPAAAASAAPKAALSVRVTTPQPATLAQTLPALGNLAAWQEVIIGAETGGLRLVELGVQVGDRVRKGQLLARLQSDTLAAEVAATRAAVAEATAVLSDATANAERARALAPSGAISTQQLQQDTTAEATARARLQSLQARLSADTLRLNQTRITAPDDGVISARLATPGAVVQSGQELLRLIRQGRLEWRAEVPGADMARLVPGTVARLVPAGTTTTLEGRVRTTAPSVDPATRQGLVYVDLPAGAAARAGMHARGEFILGQSAALTLPQTAVLLRDGYSYVFRVGADGRVQQTKVQVGRRSGERVEITGGLDPKASVVAQGVGFLGDGDRVRVVAAGTGATP